MLSGTHSKLHHHSSSETIANIVLWGFMDSHFSICPNLASSLRNLRFVSQRCKSIYLLPFSGMRYALSGISDMFPLVQNMASFPPASITVRTFISVLSRYVFTLLLIIINRVVVSSVLIRVIRAVGRRFEL